MFYPCSACARNAPGRGGAPQPVPRPQPPALAQPGDPNVKLEVLQPKEGTLPDVPKDTVILKVGEEKITAGEFAEFIETLPEQVRGQARGSARKQLAENMIKVKLIAQEARRQKADQEKLFKLQAGYQLDNLLAVYYLNNYLKTAKVSDEELKKYYEEHKKDYESMRARHVLVRFKGSRVPLKPDQKDLTEQEALEKANAVRKRIQGGADFAQVAKEEIRRRRFRVKRRQPGRISPGHDGRPVRRGCRQTAPGRDQRTGDDAVRISHHPGTGARTKTTKK